VLISQAFSAAIPADANNKPVVSVIRVAMILFLVRFIEFHFVSDHSTPSRENICGFWTSVLRISKARKTYFRRSSFSFSGGRFESPRRLVIVCPRNARLIPTIFATGGTAVI